MDTLCAAFSAAIAAVTTESKRCLIKKVIYTVCLLVLLSLSSACSNNHSYRFLTENDSYHPVERPDANYTSGLSLMAYPAKSYHKGKNPVVDKFNIFQFGNSYPVPITLEYGVGQIFYTPDDIAVSSLDDIDRNGRVLRLDRPYAGFLFLEGSIHNHYGQEYDWTTDMRRSVSAKIGLTGNGSLAEEVHTGVHERRDLIVPQGWGLQVGQELGFTFGLEQQNRILAVIGKRWGADVITNVQASVGNFYTGLDAGVTLRFGLNLPRGYHQKTIAPYLMEMAPAPALTEEQLADPDYVAPIPRVAESIQSEAAPDWHLYGFIGQQNRWVFRDLSLDGRLFYEDIHTVKKEPLVNEFQYGLQFRFKEHWGLQVLFAHRSDQLEDQRKEHSFGQYVLMYQLPFGLY